ncbi:MAG TPA: hypothetical protein VGK67_17460 [Myxococcales bacterium]|jgi:hypothetical protein
MDSRLPRNFLLLASALAPLAVVKTLWAGLMEVETRFAFGWDGASRSLQDLEAAWALQHLEPLRFLRVLLLQQHWPTLRMLIAAPLQLIMGPSHEVESAITVASYVLLLPLLAWGAWHLMRTTTEAVLASLLGSLAVLANGALLVHSAGAMLEAQSALMTLAATIAWMRLREPGSEQRVGPLAVAANLLFHTKLQYGAIFAATVLLTEALLLSREERSRALAGLASVGRAALRRWTTWLFLGVVAVCGALALWASSGGFVQQIGTVTISMRRATGPLFWAAFALFWGLQWELWRSRSQLAPSVPQRLRALWAWLVVPMGAWLLVPFSRRLEVHVSSAVEFESFAPVDGFLARWAYYPKAAAAEWYGPLGWAAIGAAVAFTVASALRYPEFRRRLIVPAAVILGEWAALTLLTRNNFVPRFALNLVPVLALFCVLWIPALRHWPWTLAGLGVCAGLAAAMISLWSPPALATTLRGGFEEGSVQQRCAALVASSAPPDVVDALPDRSRRDCQLQLQLAAWRQGRWLEWKQ